MPPRKFIGVDPGASGGLAAISVADNAVAILTQPTADMELKDIWEWFVWESNSGSSSDWKYFAAIEKVSGYVGVNQPGSFMFNFGASFGRLQAFLVAAAIPFEEVTPQRWQKELGIPSRDKEKLSLQGIHAERESKQDHKAKLQRFAQNLFPRHRITLATADAVCLAEWCRRKYGIQE